MIQNNSTKGHTPDILDEQDFNDTCIVYRTWSMYDQTGVITALENIKQFVRKNFVSAIKLEEVTKENERLKMRLDDVIKELNDVGDSRARNGERFEELLNERDALKAELKAMTKKFGPIREHPSSLYSGYDFSNARKLIKR